jgi:hypothetical protein
VTCVGAKFIQALNTKNQTCGYSNTLEQGCGKEKTMKYLALALLLVLSACGSQNTLSDVQDARTASLLESQAIKGGGGNPPPPPGVIPGSMDTVVMKTANGNYIRVNGLSNVSIFTTFYVNFSEPQRADGSVIIQILPPPRNGLYCVWQNNMQTRMCTPAGPGGYSYNTFYTISVYGSSTNVYPVSFTTEWPTFQM